MRFDDLPAPIDALCEAVLESDRWIAHITGKGGYGHDLPQTPTQVKVSRDLLEEDIQTRWELQEALNLMLVGPLQRPALEEIRHHVEHAAWVVGQATDEEVGPACMYVEVPPTIATDPQFREIYGQGYRHALDDVRAAARLRGR